MLVAPTLDQLETYRSSAIRPSVVCCCVCNNKILYPFKKAYSIWLFPQGGIRPGEDLHQATVRELEEELGVEFMTSVTAHDQIFGEYTINYKESRRGVDMMKLSDGTEVPMMGKHYYYVLVNVSTEAALITSQEFDEFFWLDFTAAYYLADVTPQVSRREMSLDILDKLKAEGLLK